MSNKKAYLYLTKNNGFISTQTELLEHETEITTLIHMDEAYRTAEEVFVYAIDQSSMALDLIVKGIQGKLIPVLMRD